LFVGFAQVLGFSRSAQDQSAACGKKVQEDSDNRGTEQASRRQQHKSREAGANRSANGVCGVQLGDLTRTSRTSRTSCTLCTFAPFGPAEETAQIPTGKLAPNRRPRQRDE
jgi:hypothetical protein